ncbi:ATP-binding protein [Ornithinibacillus salinisoli]|uniref:histidine kinase n=1 Tax=Ornithinibacillus salinisoli TaxID=1848459 RepID=A0ABW4VZK2_9BACI
MKQTISIITSVLIIVLTLLGLISKWFGNENVYHIENGVLDLRNWNTMEEGTVKLNGEWEFYKNKLIDPEEFAYYSHEKSYIKVPGNWDSEFTGTKNSIETGTYRLSILVPEKDRFGLQINSIRHASKTFINGEFVGGMGITSSLIDEHSYREGKYLVFPTSKNGLLEIVIHVSNTHGVPNGGIVKSISFGEMNQIISESNRSKFFDGIIVGGYFLLGIIFFFYFVLNKKALDELYFALFCFLQGVYVSTQNEKLIYLFFQDIPMNVLLSIQLSFISLSVLFFLLFINHVFKKHASNRLTKWVASILIIQAIYLGIPKPPSELLNLPVQSIQILFIIIMVIAFIYIIFILIKSIYHRVQGARYLLVAGACFTSYGFSLGLELFLEIDVSHIPLTLFLIMTISFSFFIGYRRILAYEKIDTLSKEVLVQSQIKDQFLLKTTEELITPLHKIIQYSDMLMQGKRGPLKKMQHELVFWINHACKKIYSLVKDFNFVRIHDDKLNLKPVRLELINEMVEELSIFIKEPKKISIEKQIPANLPFVIADESGLRQILFQILQNAITFTKVGKITVSAYQNKDKIHISIEDTGVGMEEEYAERIFENFFQIPQQNNSEREGIGLGLSITKKLVELMGGKIWVDSVPGKGSCFTFSLQVYRSDNEVATSVTEIEPLEYPIKQFNSNHSNVILLVDQNHHQLANMMNLLINQGNSVIACDKGSDAYDLITLDSIELAVIDIKTQDVSGVELTKKIREDFHLAELPILLLSVSGHPFHLPSSVQLGANDVIQKPVDENEFISRIQSLLSIKEAFKESIHNELMYFQGQIAPHFLYNTLNTIIGLSYQDIDKTREALEHLSIYFRSKLDYQKQESLVALEEEIEFVQSYLTIEKLRYGDNLQIVYNIDHDIDTLIPAMTIQPLVENAVQHGLSKKTGGGTLKLSVKKVANQIKIVVEDDGLGISIKKQDELLSSSSSRIGFKNPFEKLKLIKNSSFQLVSKEGKGTKIIILLKS